MRALVTALWEAASLAADSMTWIELAVPVVLALLLAVVGAWSARRDRRSYARLLRRSFIAAMLLTVAGATLVLWFASFDAETISNSSTTPERQTGWLLAMSLLGAGLSLLAGTAAYTAGGWFSGALGGERRSSLIIALDGPAASGKGTLAKRIAAHYGLAWLDTGLLYRAVARDVLANGGNLEDVAAATVAARAIVAESLADPGLRGPRAGDAASIVAKIPEVRAALLDYQRAFARQDGGAVLDGRDIGTVVCPQANVKIFVTASDEARARRRFIEHQGRGESITYAELLEDIRRRDARDKSRSVSPLEAAADALHLDTTELDADLAFAAALRMIEAKLKA